MQFLESGPEQSPDSKHYFQNKHLCQSANETFIYCGYKKLTKNLKSSDAYFHESFEHENVALLNITTGRYESSAT